MSAEIVLSSDRGSFTDYSGANPLGYVACMPHRLVPRILMDKVFTPPMKSYSSGEAIDAPYALRKVEAIISGSGYRSVAVAPPEKLSKIVDRSTRVLGISVHDPYGLSPVSTKLSLMFGGGRSWTAKFFEDLGETIVSLKNKYHFTVFAGGPGVWQMDLQRPEWVDVVFNGEAELDLPPLIRKILSGEPFPAKVNGRDPKVDQIPTIIKPARFGEVQVTRGCPRGCQFCSITPEMFRSIPMKDIMAEVSLNLRAGHKSVDLVTDDILLYGSKKLETNHQAVVDLFRNIREAGVEEIYFPHISSPAVKDSPETVMEISNIAEYDKYRGEIPVVGLESGSTRIIEKYMRGKAFPWGPADWGDIIVDSAGIMNDAFITPCFTMTIGFSDESNDDVRETIKLSERIINSGSKAFLFPLPVIPITRSRLKNNSFPEADLLPESYWELLYVSWKNDIDLIRRMIPDLTYRMNSAFMHKITGTMMDRIFGSIENMFRDLMETRGKKAMDYGRYDLGSAMGLFRSFFKLIRSPAVKTALRRKREGYSKTY
ncbi:MAG: B12-binding domain-containing radical SAM protein [Candidatus Thermoplasmatota archaeon]|nr:B12-binding domain-containing radical SAM protein [Candidatus Thermoplasmatota archaeon]